MKRRTFLKSTLAGSAIAVAVSAGLLVPSRVLAAWPKEAFEAKTLQDAIRGIFGSDLSEASSDIKITAPDIAENGAVVPVKVDTSMKTDTIALLVEKNGTPMTASFTLGATAKGHISTRIKMGKTSDVVAVVKSGGKIYSARKEVKVTIGGCGG